jgi:hypothetical protein
VWCRIEKMEKEGLCIRGNILEKQLLMFYKNDFCRSFTLPLHSNIADDDEF